MYGDAGDDTVRGFAGSDLVDGGPGRDLIEGDTGIYSDGGSDTIMARDGEADRITCGYGTDTVVADSIDAIEGGGECESVDVSAPDPGSGGGGGGGGMTFAVGLRTRARSTISALISRRGFTFRVSASDGCRGTGKLRVAARQARRLGLGRRAVTLVSQHATIPAAGVYGASLRPAAKYRAALRRAHRVRATVTFSCVASGVTERAAHRVMFTS